MKKEEVLFWNVDTQFDFVEPEGKLYVPGAEKLKDIWEAIRKLAEKNEIRVINTCDWHNPNSKELSEAPDFISTFPEHCMANSKGAEFVTESNPKDSIIISWDKATELDVRMISKKRNITIRKDAFDVFAGNPFTDEILQLLNPKKVIVYGVTTNVCVNDAVVGLSKWVGEVIVVENAIKELPNIPLPFNNWDKLGVKRIQLKQLENMFL